MPAKYEQRIDKINTSVWVGKYYILHNLPHWHLAPELIMCCSGSAVLVLDGHVFQLIEGDAALCPGSSVHFISTEREGALLVAQIDSELYKQAVGELRMVKAVFPDRYGIADRLESVCLELDGKKPFYLQRTKAMMTELLVDIFRGEKSVEGTRSGHSTVMLRYKNLLSEIYENYEFITFSDAAVYMNMSEAYFSRFFKKLSGVTFSDYLNIVKVDKAVELLHQDPNITAAELMMRCGFNTLRHFYRIFKQYTGYTPGQLPPQYNTELRELEDDSTGFDPTLPTTVEM